MLSLLEAADVAVKFSHLTSRPTQEFKSDVTRWLKELARVDSDAVRNASLLRAQRLGTSLAFSYMPPESIIPAADLDRYAYDLPELLYRLDITQPKGDVQTWLEDRGVQKGLGDSLAETSTPELKLRCAAWLRYSSLSKVTEIQIPSRPLKSHLLTALEVLAGIASDPAEHAPVRVLAKSVLAKDEFVLALWKSRAEYIPLVYELWLALDEWLFSVKASPGKQDWHVVE